MMARPSLRFIGLLLLSISLSLTTVAAGACKSCGILTFRENKGQWNKNVLFKTEMFYASAYFEKNRISYELFDSTDMKRLRHDLHKEIHYKQEINPVIHGHAFRAVFVGSNINVKPAPLDPQGEYYNYYLGKDHSKWAFNVKAYHEVLYSDMYDHTDLHVYSSDTHLKYDWIIRKGDSKSSAIQIRYDGTDAVTLKEDRLTIKTSVGSLIESEPYAYQEINGERKQISCHYVLKDGLVSFSLPDGWDHRYDLVIDPTLIFSSYSGSTADNFGYTATYDSRGNAYAAGSVFHQGQYPVTLGAFQSSWAGGYGYNQPNFYSGTGTDIGITKYSSDGTQRLYSTYLGGDRDELPHSLIVNSNDELFVFGTTSSDNFPTTANAYDTMYNGGVDAGLFSGLAVHYNAGSDIFVTRFNQAGSALLASTYLGGSGNDGLNYPEYQFLNYQYADEVRGVIDIDKNDNVYIASCTRSRDFPTTPGAYQTALSGLMDGVLVKLDNNLTNLIWSTYLGGNDRDAIYSLALDDKNNVFVCGGTASTDFPGTAGTYQPTSAGGRAEGFITLVNQNGSGIIRSTLYGTPDYDQLFFVQTDRRNNVYVLGQTFDTTAMFTKNAAYNVAKSGQYISKFNYTLDTLVWSTRFGNGRGIPDISPTAFLVDRCNSVYMAGWGSDFLQLFGDGVSLSTNGLYVTPNAFQTTTDGNDFYVMVMKDDASAITYATYFGSPVSEDHVDGGTSRFDKKGVIYESVCAGCGANSDFPTYPANVVSHVNPSPNCNNAIFKLDLDLPIVIADFQQPPAACDSFDYQFINKSKIYDTASTTVTWLFGDGTTSSQLNPSHQYNLPGVYTITLIVADASSCNGSDTVSKQIMISRNDSTIVLADRSGCPGAPIQIGVPASADTATHYAWTPVTGISDPTASNPYVTIKGDATYQLLQTDLNCRIHYTQRVKIAHDSINATGANVLCPNDTIRLSVSDTAGQPLSYTWSPSAAILTGGNTATPTVRPSVNTTYTVVAVNPLTGCMYSDTITVNVISSLQSLNAIAIPDTIQFGDTSQLYAQYLTATTLRWDVDSTLSSTVIDSPKAFPKVSTTYWVTLTDQSGCSVRDSVRVKVLRTPCASANLFVPNAFSPNNDGKNDKLYVRGNNISDLYFTVYDRWGQKVFETRDINIGWDGIFHGSRQDPAVFGWYVEGTCEGGEKFFQKGNVTLLR